MSSGLFRRVLIATTGIAALVLCHCGVAPPAPPVPAAPTGVAAGPGDGSVTILWQDVRGAISYALYWSPSAGVTKVSGTRIGGVTSPYVHAPLTNGATYHYVVTAVGRDGEGPASDEVAATPTASPGPPPAPTGLTARPGTSQVLLTWDPVPGATSYDLYWATTPGVTRSHGNRIPAVSSPYIHTALADSTTYYYVVTAVGPGGESAESTEVSASTSQTGPVL